MSRTSFLGLAVAFGLFVPTAECEAQVGFGAQQQLVSSGINLNVAPVVTNSRRFARIGVSAGFSQVVDVQTFSPVQGFPGLAPSPIGFGGFGGVGGAGINPGLGGRTFGNSFSASRSISKPTASRFVDGAWKLDKDKDSRLNRDELGQLASVVVAELRRTQKGAYKKLKLGAQGTGTTKKKKIGKTVSQKEITDAFLKQCLTYDRDKDNALNAAETDQMAAALMRFLK